MASLIQILGSSESFLYPSSDDYRGIGAWYLKHNQSQEIFGQLQQHIPAEGFEATLDNLANLSENPLGRNYSDSDDDSRKDADPSLAMAGDPIRASAALDRFTPVMTGLSIAGPIGALLGIAYTGIKALTGSDGYSDKMDLADAVDRSGQDLSLSQGLIDFASIDAARGHFNPVKDIAGNLVTGNLMGVFSGVLKGEADHAIEGAYSNYSADWSDLSTVGGVTSTDSSWFQGFFSNESEDFSWSPDADVSFDLSNSKDVGWTGYTDVKESESEESNDSYSGRSTSERTDSFR